MKEKITNFAKDHKKALIITGVIAAGVGGAIIGDYITMTRISIGLKAIHDKGIIKLFNPDTGLEITVNEAVELMKDM